MCVDKNDKLHTVHMCYKKPDATLSIGDSDNKVTFTVKRRLSMDEFKAFVDNVCGCVVNPDIKTYCPEMKDYYIRIETIKNYTDLNVIDESQWWNIVYGTPIYAMITGSDRRPVIFEGREYDDNIVIDTGQYECMLDAIEKKIEYYVDLISTFTE